MYNSDMVCALISFNFHVSLDVKYIEDCCLSMHYKEIAGIVIVDIVTIIAVALLVFSILIITGSSFFYSDFSFKTIQEKSNISAIH